MSGTEDIIKKGLLTWKSSIGLAVPFILNAVAQLLLLAAALIASAFVFFGGLSIEPAGISPDAFRDSLSLPLLLSLSVIIIMFVLASNLASSYFSAVAIVMSANALKAGTHYADPWRMGLVRLTGVFFANMLVLALITIIVIPAVALSAIAYTAYPSGGFPEFGWRCLALSVVLSSVLFGAAPYAIVLRCAGPAGGLKESFDLLNDNRLPYLVLWIFQYFILQFLTYAAALFAAAAFAVGLLFVPLPQLSALLPLSGIGDSLAYAAVPLGYVLLAASAVFLLILAAFDLVFVSPVATLWWTQFYIERTRRKT
jgi:hypothetical protein